MSLWACLPLLTALGSAPPSPARDAPQPDAPQPDAPQPGSPASLAEPHIAFVAGEGLDLTDFQLEIAMRAPELEIVPADAPRPDAPFVYMQALHESGRLYRIALIFSDGRAFYGRIDVGEAGSPERVLASAIASLLASIDAGTVEPDALGVRAPLAAPPPEPSPSPPPAEPVVDAPSPAPAPPQPQAESGLQLGLHLGIHQLTAIGNPAFADRHLGWYGAVGLELRSAKGLFAAFELQPGGVHNEQQRLTRIPLAAQLGYAWRHAGLELIVAGGLSITPWLVTTEGQSAPVTKIEDGRAGRPPLFGVGLRLSPGYLIQLPRRTPLAALRVGPRVGLDGSFVLSSPPRVAGLESVAGEELFRLGGLELELGFEFVLWFSPARRS